MSAPSKSKPKHKSAAKKPAAKPNQKTSLISDLSDVTVEYLGREWEISGSARDDWELLEAIADDDMLGVMRAMKRLLGGEQYEVLKDMLRTDDGRVPASTMRDALSELFTAIDAAARNADSLEVGGDEGNLLSS